MDRPASVRRSLEPGTDAAVPSHRDRPFDFHPRTRLIFGDHTSDRLGELAAELGFRRTLLVADHGLQAVGHVDRASTSLRQAGISVFPFHEFESNPDSNMVEAGRAFAEPLGIDSLVAGAAAAH